MTALPARRTRRTVVGAIVAVVLVLVAAGLAAAGAITVANSTAGETVAVDTRPVVSFPNTDNAALAVVDDEGRLTTLIIATLAPSGVGGSIVTIPVNADASVGLGDQRRPLDGVLDALLGDPVRFFEAVEGTLAISLQFGEIVSEDRLATLIEPVVPASVTLSKPVYDSLRPGSGQVLPAGDTLLTERTATDALRAFDEAGESYDHHVLDVEMWSALAANAPVADAQPPPIDDNDQALPTEDIDELFTRLWAGPVQVRDVRVSDAAADGDSVVIDRHDSLLVFAQVSPARVSTPNPGLVFRVIVPYSDEQILSTGGQFETRSELARGLIGELLFLSANVVSADTSANSGDAPKRNLIEVADERFIDDIATLVPLVFGESDVVVATELVDGVDVVMTLGEGYLDRKREQGGEPSADDANPADTVSADG